MTGTTPMPFNPLNSDSYPLNIKRIMQKTLDSASDAVRELNDDRPNKNSVGVDPGVSAPSSS